MNIEGVVRLTKHLAFQYNKERKPTKTTTNGIVSCEEIDEIEWIAVWSMITL